MLRSTIALALIAAAIAVLPSNRAIAAGGRLNRLDQATPAVGPTADGFLVVWVEDRGDGPRLYRRLLSAAGLPTGGAAQAGVEAQPLTVAAEQSKPEQAWPSIIGIGCGQSPWRGASAPRTATGMSTPRS